MYIANYNGRDDFSNNIVYDNLEINLIKIIIFNNI